MSNSVICSGWRASFEPPIAPVCETTSFDSANSHSIRRMTTGLVLTLSATASDLSGSSSAHAINVRTWTATANRLLVDIRNQEPREIGDSSVTNIVTVVGFVKTLILIRQDLRVLETPD